MNNKEVNELKKNRTIPIFDCLYEIDEQLEFYTALGFDIIYYQKAPYRFASVKHEFTELSFYGDKSFDLEQKQGGCYIVVSDIDTLYNKLKVNLKAYYGKIPVKGLPRFSRLNLTAEDRRFNITDPSGNTLIIGEPLGDSTTLMEQDKEETTKASPFEKAYRWACRYAYSKEDFLGASNLLESSFTKHNDSVSNELFFKAKVLHLDILITLDRISKAKETVKTIESIALTSDEVSNLQNELHRLAELKGEYTL